MTADAGVDLERRPRLGAAGALGAFAFFAALSVFHTWPLASAPTTLSRNDNGDTALNTWAICWIADHVLTDPLRVFEGNIFHPERHTVAFSEPVVVPGLLSVPVRLAGASPVLTYNISLMVGYGLSGLAMFWLMWRWTGRYLASLIAGTLFAFNAYTLVRMPQLQAIHTQGLPLVLLGFDGVLRGGATRSALMLAAGGVIVALTSGYSMVFGLVMLGVSALVRPGDWLGPRFKEVVKAGALAAGVSLVVLTPLIWVYAEVRREHGVVQDLDLIRSLSGNWSSFVATAGRLHYETWSREVFERWPPREALFPGLVALSLVIVYLASPEWRRDGRARMLLAIAIAGIILHFGPYTPVYSLVYNLVPFGSSVRVASRFGYLLLIGVAGLAGLAMAAAQARATSRRWLAVPLLVLVLVNVEASRVPVGYIQEPEVSRVYRTLASLPEGLVAEMPFWIVQTDVHRNALHMVMATLHRKPLLNGYSGFVPYSYRRNSGGLWFFPFRESAFETLRELGVRYVVMHLPEFEATADSAIEILANRPDFRLVDADEHVRLYERLDAAQALGQEREGRTAW
jgi:hypothetical protein